MPAAPDLRERESHRTRGTFWVGLVSGRLLGVPVGRGVSLRVLPCGRVFRESVKSWGANPLDPGKLRRSFAELHRDHKESRSPSSRRGALPGRRPALSGVFSPPGRSQRGDGGTRFQAGAKIPRIFFTSNDGGCPASPVRMADAPFRHSPVLSLSCQEQQRYGRCRTFGSNARRPAGGSS